MVISRGLAAPRCSKEGISMVENMKGAHVAKAECWGHIQQGRAKQQLQLGHPEIPPWLQEHKHLDIYGWMWLTNPQSSPAPRLELVSFYSSSFVFQVKWTVLLVRAGI